jgi:hypothetical protein
VKRALIAGCIAALAVAAAPAGAAAKTRTVTTTQTFTASGPNAVPGTGGGSLAAIYPWDLAASGLLGTTRDVDVTLTGLAHERVSDVDALLVAPNGSSRKALFMSDVGDGTDIPPPGINVAFDDGAASKAPIGAPLTPSTFKPTNGNGGDLDLFLSPAPPGPFGSTLSALDGGDPNGTWSLYLIDDDANAADPAAGSVQGFSLRITSRLSVKIATTHRHHRHRCHRRHRRGHHKKHKRCHRHHRHRHHH